MVAAHERLAAIARLLQPILIESLALRADKICDELAERWGMVAWDRERLIGQIQRQLFSLREQRFGRPGGAAVRILERRQQPLECLEPVWRYLRKGRRVVLEWEPGCSVEVVALMQSMASLIGETNLQLAGALTGAEPKDGHLGPARVGVASAPARVALLQEDGDRELAAYVLVRACLRRTGFDPRCVHRVVVVGSLERLERNLRRLWVGAAMGPSDDDLAFAGPVTEAEAERFLSSERRWRLRPGARVLCSGGRLEHTSCTRQRPAFLAPALIRVAEDPESPSPEPLEGPLLLIHPVADADAGTLLLDRLAPSGTLRLRIGESPRGLQPQRGDRQFHGALLAERLPPGLPEPRP